MWITTPNGYYSAVQHNTDANILVVRSRVYQDSLVLARFLTTKYPKVYKGSADVLIQSHGPSDYPWRVFVNRKHFEAFVSYEVANITYGNFKGHVGKVQGYQRADVYSKVWSTLLQLEYDDPANTRQKWGKVGAQLVDMGYDLPGDSFDDAFSYSDDYDQVKNFLAVESPKKRRKRSRK